MPLMGGAIAAPILGAGIGYLASQGDAEQAAQLRQQALAKIAGITQPDLKAVALQHYTAQGIFTPGEEKAIQQDPSNLQKIRVNDQFKLAQTQSLQKMQDLSNTPFTSADRAAIQDVNLEADRSANARRQSILQGMASRGMGGGGADLAAQLQGQQEQSNLGAQRGRDLTQAALSRQIQAIQSAGQMGTQYGSQDFEQQAKQAEAQDIINKFNAQQMQGVQQRNVDRDTQAKIMDFQNQQDILNRNTNTSQQQQMYNQVQLPQQQFANQFGIANAQAGALGQSAGQHQQQAQNTQNTWSQLGSGIGQGAGAAASYSQGQQGLDLQKQKMAQDQENWNKQYGE